jgi:oleate hydratase
MVAGISKLNGIMRTVYNQYDSMVRPLSKWLEQRGVQFVFNAKVVDLEFCHDYEGRSVERISYQQDGRAEEIWVKKSDLVIVTLGSMTEGSSLGSMSSAPILKDKRDGGAWTLWERLVERVGLWSSR